MSPLPPQSSLAMLRQSLPKVFKTSNDDTFTLLLRALDGADTRHVPQSARRTD